MINELAHRLTWMGLGITIGAAAITPGDRQIMCMVIAVIVTITAEAADYVVKRRIRRDD